MANMAIPVTVTLDRGDLSPLDLTPMIEPGSLNWSSVVPGGFASCSFQINGDFRRLLKLLPFLSIVRVVGDSGRVLFEGQIEDLSPTLSESAVGITVGAFGLQNVLKETSVRAFWSKRDMQWVEIPGLTGMQAVGGGTLTWTPAALNLQTGNFDPTDLSLSGVLISTNSGQSYVADQCEAARWIVPVGLSAQKVWLTAGVTNEGSNVPWGLWALKSGASTFGVPVIAQNGVAARTEYGVSLTNNPTEIRLGVYTAAHTGDGGGESLFNIRVLGTSTDEDVHGTTPNLESGGGFYGATLINGLLALVPELGAGVVEAGTDFVVEMLDASVRRTAYDILTEIASYYSREWAVWENALLNWVTPNLQQPQWIVPISVMSSLDLDASVQNSQKQSIVLYTDAASQVTAEASATSTDRRNPYVLRGRTKDQLNTQNLTMTANTAQQFANIILNDLGFGPVPASGSLVLPGETIVSHASASARKAWEIRAGDNVMLPELPLADVFTQDGRGECLFHIVSAEADSQSGNVTLTLDSYGSKRSDVLLARLAAVTSLLGG